MLNYLLIGIAVVALAALAMWGTGGVAFFIILPLTRFVPFVAAILATVAVAMLADKAGVGWGPVAMFAVPILLIGLFPLLSYVPALGRIPFLPVLFFALPALSIFPALSLLHIARHQDRRT